MPFRTPAKPTNNICRRFIRAECTRVVQINARLRKDLQDRERALTHEMHANKMMRTAFKAREASHVCSAAATRAFRAGLLRRRRPSTTSTSSSDRRLLPFFLPPACESHP